MLRTVQLIQKGESWNVSVCVCIYTLYNWSPAVHSFCKTVATYVVEANFSPFLFFLKIIMVIEQSET